jgi:hypothetical protein
LSLSEEFKSLIFEKNRFEQLVETFLRDDEQYTKYQLQVPAVQRDSNTDRVFPLETVELQRFKNETELDTDRVLIHTGPYADELARSFNALALTFANDIFFRNNAFTTYTEEGKKTLAHELTHIAQYKEGRIKNRAREELEEEAEENETRTGYTDSQYMVFRIDAKLCRIKKSEINRFVSEAAVEVERMLVRKKHELDGEKYLRLLIEYEKMLKGV